jgi:hypothetical protein
MGIIETIISRPPSSPFLNSTPSCALHTQFLDVFWDEINRPTCSWITQPRSIKATDQLEQLRRVVAMIPLAHQPAPKLRIINLNAFPTVDKERSRPVARRYCCRFPACIVCVAWIGIEGEGKQIDIELKVRAVEESSRSWGGYKYWVCQSSTSVVGFN